MDEIREQFVRAAQAGERAGFDLLELHCAHGYLLSSFISPLTNQRTDEYGGSLQNRLRYPLEVFDAVRAVWPAPKPMSVRISATDWCDGGVDADDAVEIARAFAAHGADAIDVSTGQVTKDERPAYGRSYQTPFADRIRNEVGIATIAVGVISSYDDVNSIVLAGRADMCPRAGPPVRPALDAARGRGPGVQRTSSGVARSVQGRQSQAAGRAHRRTQTTAAAHPRRRDLHTPRPLAAAARQLIEPR